MQAKNKLKIQIPQSIRFEFGAFFAFFIFNSLLVHLRGFFIALTFLSLYYFSLAAQKLLLKI